MAPRKSSAQEPPTRTFADWSPTLLRVARIQADSGHLRMAADLCEAMLADDRIQGVLRTRTRGLIGLKLTFEGGRGPRRRAALRALEAEEDWWTAYPEETLVQLLDWGTMLGVGLAQQLWEELPSGRWIGRLKIWHPRWLRYDWQRRAWMLTVDGGGEIEIAPGDGEWILYTPGGAHRPWVSGAWRALGKWWLLKEYAREDWARHSEVYGQPIRVGEGPVEASSAEKRKELADDLGDLGSDTSVVPPAGWTVKLLEGQGSTWQMFPQEIAVADEAIAIVIVGQNLTTSVSEGSRAAATVHESVKAELIQSDGETLSTTMHDQALVWWAEFNFGDRRVAPWPSWDTTPPEDVSQKVATWTSLGAAIEGLDKVLSSSDLEIDLSEALRIAGVPVRIRPEGSSASKPGQVFKYHLDYGVLTINELRAGLGLTPTENGNVPPTPVASQPSDSPSP